MTWGMIGTWRMALEGLAESAEKLKEGGLIGDAIEQAIKQVENHPDYRSVGYGGLPNREGIVELDAGFMDGDSLSVGAVGAIKDFKNPIAIAKKLMTYPYNNFLVGTGAELYGQREHFERCNMLSSEGQEMWKEKMRQHFERELKPYDGHDTVGVVGVDTGGHMAAATSTSGLFMKHLGRVGDSPVVGSGFYADSDVGAAAATGLGEDLMKGCISYEIVRLIGEGHSPQMAAEQAVKALNDKLIRKRGKAGDLSVVCMNTKGEWGVATNIHKFSFVVVTEDLKPSVYIASFDGEHTHYEAASQEWIDTHTE